MGLSRNLCWHLSNATLNACREYVQLSQWPLVQILLRPWLVHFSFSDACGWSMRKLVEPTLINSSSMSRQFDHRLGVGRMPMIA